MDRFVGKWCVGLGATLVLALALRVGWGLWWGAQGGDIEAGQSVDLAIARNVMSEGRLAFFDQRFSQWLYAFRPPGYPVMLAACGAGPGVARGVQALIGVLTVLGVYLLGRRWLEPGPSVIAAALVALNPALVVLSGLLVPETLWAGLLVWGMVLLVGTAASADRSADPGRWAVTLRWLGGGVVLALSVLVKPEGAGLVVLLGVLAALVNRRQPGAYQPRWFLPPGTTLLLLVTAALTGWAYRNSKAVGYWVWTTTGTAFNVYDGVGEGTSGGQAVSERAGEEPPAVDPHARFAFVRWWPQLRVMSEVGRSHYLWERAGEDVRAEPRLSLQRAADRAVPWWGPGSDTLATPDTMPRFVRVAQGGYAVTFLLLVLVGWVRGRLGWSAKLFLSIPAVYVTGLVALSIDPATYRAAVEPPMAVIAASLAVARGPGWKRAGGDTDG